MFEDVEVIGKSDFIKRLTSMVVSILVHTLMIILVIVVPLLAFNKLPESEILTFLIAPPPPPPPTNVQKTPKVAVIDPNQFVAPTEIPTEIPPPEDEAPNSTCPWFSGSNEMDLASSKRSKHRESFAPSLTTMPFI